MIRSAMGLLLLLLPSCSANWEACVKENNYCDHPEESYDSDGDGHDDYGYGGDDCDDNDAAVHPGAEPDCATLGADFDCDGYEDIVTCDVDGDGMTPLDGDCNDYDVDAYTGATELCDEVDQNCDGADVTTEECVDPSEPVGDTGDTGGSDTGA